MALLVVRGHPGPPTADTGPGAGHDCGPLVKNNAN